MNFIEFRDHVNKQLNKITKNTNAVFLADLTEDELWGQYLSSFPEGSNPIFRENTVHDCNCCRRFIRDVGGIVVIDANGKRHTPWSFTPSDKLDPAYGVVVEAMNKLVINAKLKSMFFTSERLAGAMRNFDAHEAGMAHDHFFWDIPRNFVTENPQNEKSKYDPNLMMASFANISTESIDIVLDLISQNSIYRGAEFKRGVTDFRKILKEYETSGGDEDVLFKLTADYPGMARFKNTVIGTLLVDISSGVELEDAVRSFERKVAPENYQRTSSLVTKSMIEAAEKKVKELGLESAMLRRPAVPEDIPVSEVSFVDFSYQDRLLQEESVFDVVKKEAPTRKASKMMKAVEEVSFEKFMNEILPRANEVELMLENRLQPNLMAVVAPVAENAGQLMKWDNNFSWSYRGGVADSLTERVRSKGGNVDTNWRASLGWWNLDDLDIHLYYKHGRRRDHVHFREKRARYCGARLDVDMNVLNPTPNAVENIFFNSQPEDGTYLIKVNNFTKRSNDDVGFELFMKWGDTEYRYHYPKALADGSTVKVVTLEVKGGEIVDIKHHIDQDEPSSTVWGLKTQEFHPVSMIMNSPNHWGDQEVGNKHVFFILEGCTPDEPVRGMYNEFLNLELKPHRKAFEIVGSKLKVEPTEEQLAGVGVSLTKAAELVVRVKGSVNRIIKVKV